MALQSRLTVYAAIAGVLALMGGIVYYASLDNVSLDQVEVELTDVVLREAGEDEAKFVLTFLVKNPSEKIQVFSDIKEVSLKNTFILKKSDVGSEVYQSMIDEKITSFVVEGIITTQSTWSVAENEFRAEKWDWRIKMGSCYALHLNGKQCWHWNQ